MEWKYVVRTCYMMLLIYVLGSFRMDTIKVSGGEEELVIKEQKQIALTFDDGPSIHTEYLLDELNKRDVKATFFVIGMYAEERNELVKREIEEGHIVGNHTYSHTDVKHNSHEKVIDEIEKANEVIRSITGKEPEFIRPPFGEWNETLEKETGLMPVMWSVDPLDWTTENEDEIVNKVVTEIQENDIILLHDCYESSVRAAIRIVDLLQAEGYEFVTVDELLLN